jgi:hypothetical protein
MKTNRAPWDYKRPPMIVSEIVKLCALCGANMADTRNGLRCASCDHDKYHDVFEHMADVYRGGLLQQQQESARWLALSCMPQMDVALELIGAALNLDAETAAEMNRWIEENETFLSPADQHALAVGDYPLAVPDPRTDKQKDADLFADEVAQTRRMDEPR